MLESSDSCVSLEISVHHVNKIAVTMSQGCNAGSATCHTLILADRIQNTFKSLTRGLLASDSFVAMLSGTVTIYRRFSLPSAGSSNNRGVLAFAAAAFSSL